MTDKQIQNHIVHQLFDAREKKKLSQEQLAKISGISQSKISKIENGSREISATELFQLAKALKKPITFFYPK